MVSFLRLLYHHGLRYHGQRTLLETDNQIYRLFLQDFLGYLSDLLTMPGRKAIPESSPLLSIRVNYPVRYDIVPGIELHWSIVFFILVIGFGFALRRPLGVDF